MRWLSEGKKYIYKASSPDEVSFVKDHILLEGPEVQRFQYTYVESSYQVVYVVGIDTQDRVAMLHQYRYLADRVLLEIPAGSPIPGETLEAGAAREFEEETGFRVERLKKLASFYQSIGITDQVGHIFMGSVTGIGDRGVSAAEQVVLEWRNLRELYELAKKGAIENVGAAYGLLLTAAEWQREGRW